MENQQFDDDKLAAEAHVPAANARKRDDSDRISAAAVVASAAAVVASPQERKQISPS
jgi:hypothetical protein